MADDDATWAALREAAEEALFPGQTRQVADLLVALTAFEDYRDPTNSANPLTVHATPHGLAVWNYDDDWTPPGPAHRLAGLIACTEESWWRFLPASTLPPEVLEAATATWPAPAGPGAETAGGA